MRLTITTASIAFALALVLGGGIAAATVVIYNNNFSNRSEFKAVKKFEGGKACKKRHRGGKRLGVQVRRGPRQCDLRTPVVGDTSQPDHAIEVRAKLQKKGTAKRVRRRAYVGVAVRAGRESRYELRVFPHKRKWQLRRMPTREGFPLKGKDEAIEPLGGSNRIRLRAFGNTITARVNKAKVVDEVRDPNPRELNGRKTLVVAGHAQRSKRNAEALFNDVRIRLP